MAYKTVNPYTNEVVKTYDNATTDQIEQALTTGDALYHQWRHEPVSSRAASLHKIAALLREHKDELAKIAEIDYKTYGLEMLKKGASIDGKTKEELIYQDFKTYPFNDSKIGIGQISTTDPELFIKDTNEYQDLLNNIAKNNGYQILAFLVTDILNNGSYVFYNEESKPILENGFNLKDLKPAQFLKGVVSRKLQIIPAIIEQEKK